MKSLKLLLALRIRAVVQEHLRAPILLDSRFVLSQGLGLSQRSASAMSYGNSLLFSMSVSVLSSPFMCADNIYFGYGN